MINLPIFRAKKLDSDEYVEGYLEEHNKSDFYISLMPNEIDAYKIDITTLSIHFPDMIDSQGNKIFASLSEDGKGGDIFQSLHFIEAKNKKHYLYHIAKWSNKYNSLLLCNKNNLLSNDTGDGNVFYWSYLMNVEYTITGIQ